MMDGLSYTGFWWLPEKPDDQVAGILEYSHDAGLQLSLNGSFRDIEAIMSAKDHDKIFGFTSTGKRITLVDCSDTGAGTHIPGYVVENYSPSIAYAGAHIENLEETRFGHVSIQYDHLAEWVYTSGFQQSYKITPDKKLQSWELKYEYPESVTAETDIGKIRIKYGFSSNGNPIHGYSAEQSTIVEVDLGEPLGFEDLYDKIIRPLQDFLTFATGISNNVIDLYASVYDGKAGDDDKAERIQIFYRQFNRKDMREKPLDLNDMLFTSIQIPQIGFSDVVSRWFVAHADLRPALGAFFNVYYAPSMYIEEKFKNIVNALESYHRKRMRREVIPGDEYKKLVEDILLMVPKEHKSFLAPKLKYANEQILADRLRSLMEITDQASMRISRNNERFIRSVVDTRNYFTHYDESLRDRALENFELVVATRILSYMVQVILLQEIGFTPDDCVSLLSKNNEYMRYVRRAREIFAE